jgi:hypothetical protein
LKLAAIATYFISMRIAYLIKRPLNARDCERYGINYLLEKGHEVLVFNLSGLIHRELSSTTKYNSNSKRLELFEISSWAEFENHEDTLSKCDIIFFLIQSYGLAGNTLKPLRLIKQISTPYVIMGQNSVPFAEPEKKDRNAVTVFFDRLKNINFKNSIIARLPPELVGASYADYAVATCGESLAGNTLLGPKTTIIPCHTHDYGLYLQQKEDVAESKNQILFIDQYYPYHDDLIVRGWEVSAENYFRLINAAFDRIEQELNMPVVISVHPRADYSDKPWAFPGRELRTGNTIGQIAQSKLVLGHSSTVLGIAVAFNKPIIILASKELYNLSMSERGFYDGIAKFTGKKIKFIDDTDSFDLNDAFDVDEYCYKRFLEKFMRHRLSEEKPYWDTICEAVGII